MATLHFKDGTSREVSYQVGAEIKQIKDGNLRDATTAQIVYAEQVASISFPAIKQIQTSTGRRDCHCIHCKPNKD